MPEETLTPAATRSGPINKGSKVVIDRALLVVLFFNLAALIAYITLAYKFAFHSDSAAANLLAQEIYETGKYFPPDWNYVNGDLWVLFVQTWLIPFLPFMPNGYALHALGGLISASLILAGTWCVCRTLALSPRARLVAIVLVASGFSANMSENLFGQQAYGAIYFLGCFILCSSHTFLFARGPEAGVAGFATFVLLLLSAWSNPLRAVIYNVLPLVLAACWCHVRLRRQPSPASGPSLATLAVLLLIVVAACSAGVLLHAYFLARGHSSLAGVSINWLSFSEMGRNTGVALQGLLSLLSGLPVPGQPVANARGLLDAMRLTAGLALLALSGWALLRNLGTAHPGRLFIGVATLGAIGSNLFIFLTTSLPFADTPESSIRYLVPGLLGMIVILVAVVVDDHLAHAAKRAVAAVAIAVIALTAPMAYELPALAAHASIRDINNASQNVRMANFLIDNKLEYGYATFWNAGRTTVLAKHAVKVRNIEFDNGLPRPMRHLSSDRWYQPSAWTGPSFLLLSKEEMNAVKWPELKRLTGEPQRTLTFENFQVVVFDHNIARDLASWSVRVEQPLTYPALATSAHEVGAYDPVASALVAPAGTSGTLHYGPYQSLESGRYLVSFNLVAEGSGVADFGRVDVTADSGKKVFAAQPITAQGAQSITLPVTIDAFVRGLEFRVFTSGAGTLALRNIGVTKVAPDPISKVK